MSAQPLLAVPVDDRAWFMAALRDALAGVRPIMPVPGAELPESAKLPTRNSETGGSDAAVDPTLPPGTAVVIRTSGSTGRPKHVALSASALWSSASATHEALGGPGQWLIALPTHLISGLQMLVRSDHAEHAPVFAQDPGDPASIVQGIESMGADRRYLSLVPVQLARLLELAERDTDAAEALRSLGAILVGGQGVSLGLRRRAHVLELPLRRSYGMTETAGGCVYDGVEIGETRMRIRAGEVQLAGPSLALGYVGDAALTEQHFVEDEDTRWYRTGDAGELLGGMLQVTGRLDRVVVSGGINVSLDEVERVARDHHGWSSVVAVATSHPEWGERVGLVVETNTGRTEFERVQGAIRQELGAAAVPVWVTEIEELPRLPGGKPDLPAIHAWLGRLGQSMRSARSSK